jgi:hypothetical protein
MSRSVIEIDRTEAARVIAALHSALSEAPLPFTPGDREIMDGLKLRLASDLDLDATIIETVLQPSPRDPAEAVEKMLSLSAYHVTVECADALCTVARGAMSHATAGLPITYDKGGNGWFIYAGERADDGLLWDELQVLINLARKRGCEWLMLDTETPVSPNISRFDW